MSKILSAALITLFAGAAMPLAACGGGSGASSAPPAVANGQGNAAGPTPADPLGPRPQAMVGAPWQPPLPSVFKTPAGLDVWLLERHTVPTVSVAVAIPAGSSSDPKGKEGLARVTANMLDEGAGARGAIELARVLDLYGASLHTGGTEDLSFAQLAVLKRNLGAALPLLGDVVVRPRFEEADWRRTRDLWISDLRQRASDPEAVSSVVSAVALFGPENPYGHPSDGLASTAPSVQLSDVRAFYGNAWRPDRATVVVAGDVTRSEIEPLLDAAFKGWKPLAKPFVPPLSPVLVPSAPPESPRVVLVDRPDAPQSVITVIRPGVAAGDPAFPPLARVNKALGGSFTSRLNQDLREEHGWTYGAHSHVALNRGTGTIVATAAVVTEKTAEALRAMLADLDTFARDGLTEDEVSKTRLQARTDVVHQYEGVESVALRLARDATLGLPPDYEAKASALRDSADRATLNKLAATYFDRRHAVIVVVGPRATVGPALAPLGFAEPELRDAEGKTVGKSVGKSVGVPAPAAAARPAPHPEP